MYYTNETQTTILTELGLEGLMSKYDVYGIGNALVDIEYHTSIEKLSELGIEKGLMTLIDEPKQNNLISYIDDY